MKRSLLVLIALAVAANALYRRNAAAQTPPRQAVAVSFAPVLNTPDFAGVFSGKYKLDPCEGVRPMEFIALPGALFTIHGELMKDGVKVFRVTTNDYPFRPKTGLFVDARFVRLIAGPVQERPRQLPEKEEIQKRLLAALGKPYVWGGNVKDGVSLIRKYYPQGDPLVGVDCSGLLYEATDGVTTRNTSALISFGKAVPVAGLSAEEVAQRLQSLDLLVWNGHVVIVLDQDSIIESRMGCGGQRSGVMLTDKVELVRQIMKTRKPADSFPKGSAGARSFVVRRWFPADGK